MGALTPCRTVAHFDQVQFVMNVGSSAGVVSSSFAQGLFSRCSFISNRGVGDVAGCSTDCGAGALSFNHAGSQQDEAEIPLWVSQTLFRNNTSSGYGTVGTDQVNTILEDSQWESNAVASGSISVQGGYSYYAKPSGSRQGKTITANRCLFDRQSNGGGMYVGQGNELNLALTNFTNNNNKGGKKKGFVEGVEGNDAIHGGGLFSQAVTTRVHGCRFEANRAKDGMLAITHAPHVAPLSMCSMNRTSCKSASIFQKLA